MTKPPHLGRTVGVSREALTMTSRHSPESSAADRQAATLDTSALLAAAAQEEKRLAEFVDFIRADPELLTAAAERRQAEHTRRFREAVGLTPEAVDAFPEDYFNERVRADVQRSLIRREAARQLAALDAAGQPPVDIASLADVLDRPAPARDRVAGLIPSDASTLVSAQRKTGKTTFVLNLARSLLTGEDFLGRFDVVPVKGTVAILNYEVSEHMLARWAAEVGVDPQRLTLVNLRGRRNPFLADEDKAALAAALRARGTEVVIVDTFSRAFTGANPNDTGEVGAWLNQLEQWMRTDVGATDLVLTAHAGWNGERTRGASGLEDWPDAIIRLTKEEGEEGNRFMSAMGRDVDVEEDRLDFHGPTRRLTLAGVGSRKQSQQNRNLSRLAVYVVRAARENPGLGIGATDRAVRAMDDAPTFRNGDISKAAEYAQKKGQLVIEEQGTGMPKKLFPANPSQPIPTPPREYLGTPPTPPYGEGFLGDGSGSSGDDDSGRGLLTEMTCEVCEEPLRPRRAELGFTDCPACHRLAAGIGAA